jgi:hypothetical protein
MSTKLDEMWAALEAHKPKRGYAKAWATMLKERTCAAAWAAHHAAPAGSAAWWAAAAWATAADRHAQRAIDAIKGVKP